MKIGVFRMNYFHSLMNLLGAHSIDRFASIMNRKTERFNSLFWNPGSEAVGVNHLIA